MVEIIQSIGIWLSSYLGMLWDLKIPLSFNNNSYISVAEILIYLIIIRLSFNVIKRLLNSNGSSRGTDK